MARQGYGKLSNGFHSNTKVLKLQRMRPSALGVYCMAISFCSDVLNDGVMSEDDVIYQLNATEEDIEALLKVGMFERSDDGSYRIHDYLSHQSSREQVETKAEGARNRKRKQRSEADVTPESRGDETNVTSMSRRDNSNVTPESRGDSLTKNQEPITKNQKNSSNEEFSLPQTPSQAEGTTESADEDYPIEFEQFWTTYPRKTGKRKAYAAWRKARRKTNNVYLLAKASLYAADPNREPGYTLTPANWLDGEHWGDDPLPAKPKPGEPSPEAEHQRRLRDVGYLCAHVDDEECQRAALALSEQQQALARSKWPDEWYRLWRRAETLRDHEERERMEARS